MSVRRLLTFSFFIGFVLLSSYFVPSKVSAEDRVPDQEDQGTSNPQGVLETESPPTTSTENPNLPSAPVESLKEASPSEETAPPPALAELTENREEESILLERSLNVGVRIDSSFSAGDPVSQGFLIPSLRFSTYGGIGRYTDYRMSLGQTREYSTVLLTQIIPVEAYLDIGPARDEIESQQARQFRLRVGMFSPSFNPWWTPDLGELSIPDYHDAHKALFLSKELGTEVAVQAIPNILELSGGVVNGSGIMGVNTNNTRAFFGSGKLSFSLGRSKLSIGGGAYSLTQSTRGAVNYRSDWVWDGFIALDMRSILTLALDAFSGRFSDSNRVVHPRGGAGVMTLTLYRWLKLFVRAENLLHPPSGASTQNIVFQSGPLLEFGNSIRAFFLYRYQDLGTGNQINAAEVRFRLSLN